MRLERLTLRYAPGMPGGLRIDGLGEGVTVVVGPNASGKSTLARATRELLWPGTGRAGVIADAVWRDADGQAREASLLGGRVTWTPDAPRLPADEAAPRYALDIATLLQARDVDRRLGKQIAVELAGGYSIDDARRRLGGPSTTAPRNLTERLKAAQDALRQAQARADAVAHSEEGLPVLSADRDRARAARDAVPDALRALELARARAEDDAAKAAVAALPQGLDALRGTEIDEINQARTRWDKAQHELADHERARVEAQRGLDAASFAVTPSMAEVAGWQRRLEGLAVDAHRRDELGREVAGLVAREQEARAAIFVAAAEAPAPTADELKRLDALLEARLRGAAAVAGAAQVLGAWDEHLAALGEPDDSQRLRQGVEALRGWLRTPPPDATGGPELPGWLGIGAIVLGVVLVVVGALLGPAWALVALGALVAGLGGGALLARWWRRNIGAQADPRAVRAQDAEALGAAPSKWTQEAVQERLAELEERLARAPAAHLARVERRRAEGREREAGEAQASAERERLAALGALGVRREVLDLPIVQLAAAVRELVLARGERVGREAEHATLAGAVGDGLAEVGRWLAALGLEPSQDLAAAHEALVAVKGRLERADAARRDLTRLSQAIAQAKERRDAEATQMSGVFARAGVRDGDRAALMTRVEQHAAWRQATGALRDAGLAVTRLEARHRDAPGELQGLGEAEAQAALERLRSEGEAYEGLAERVTQTRAEIEAAMQGTTLADARAERDAAEDALADERLRRAEALLTERVLDDAEASHQDAHAPRLLERAREWFGRFTHHGWQLDVTADGQLVAHDARQDTIRALDELSDGTRIQLLLAARLAAIEEGEGGGEPLPLCLDEVLSTTDRVRFEAIAAALLELADAGRQILYLTANHAEVALWRQVCERLGRPAPTVVDLGAVTAAPAGWEGVTVPELPAAADVPAPEGRDSQAYARILGVRAPDPHAAVDAWHIFYALSDALPDLRRCLQAQVDTVGVWRLKRRAGVPVGVDDEVARRVDLRTRVLAATVDAWRIGRGRPVTWADVEASGAVSEGFADDARALLARHGHSAEAYVNAVGGLPRFRNHKQEELREHFEARGVLDTRDPLTEDEVVVRALQAARRDAEAGDFDVAQAERYARWVLEIIAPGAP